MFTKKIMPTPITFSSCWDIYILNVREKKYLFEKYFNNFWEKKMWGRLGIFYIGIKPDRL